MGRRADGEKRKTPGPPAPGMVEPEWRAVNYRRIEGSRRGGSWTAGPRRQAGPSRSGRQRPRPPQRSGERSLRGQTSDAPWSDESSRTSILDAEIPLAGQPVAVGVEDVGQVRVLSEEVLGLVEGG